MNLRQVLAVAAIPFLIGTSGFIAGGQANAETAPHKNMQIAQQPAKVEIAQPKAAKKSHKVKRTHKQHHQKKVAPVQK